MGKIRMLDELTANRIAAGEVVERPASVAKELMENSLDAGATAITLEIRDGGIAYLRVTDNGGGIAQEDCRLAFERHATSKIRSGDDLTRIQSLGFRGEALPSIASVSKVELTTRVKDAQSGVKLTLSAGKIEDIREAGCPLGTTFVVKDLFFNTPARRKFLRKTAVEAGYVAEVAAQLALGHPEVALRFINNGKTVYQTTGSGDLRAVVYRVFGRETANEMQRVEGSQGAVGLFGLIGVGSVARANRNYEYFFLNGRFIRSPLLSQIVEEAVSERVMIGKFPICVLNIQVPLESVDVNVHPSKLEVRFKEDFPIRENLMQILETAFPPAHATPAPRFIVSSEQLPLREPVPQTPPPAAMPQMEEPVPPPRDEDMPPLPSAQGRIPPMEDPLPKAVPPYEQRAFDMPTMTGSSSLRESGDLPLSLFKNAPAPSPQSAESQEPALSAQPPAAPTVLQQALRPVVIGQLFETYLLISKGEEFIIIDQHAAHERLLFERFSKSLGEERLTQTLLTPYLFHVSPKEEALLFENLEQLEALGFEIESFGPRVFRVLAVPQLLGEPMVQSFVADLLENLEEIGRIREFDLKRDRLVQMSCKRAIKGGDRLSDAELNDLLDQIQDEAIPLTCPHGRPILMKMTKRELERKFKRIQ